MHIEGIPEGWELVRIGTPKAFEWWMNEDGSIKLANEDSMTGFFYPVLRKIEKPKQYRAFKNAAEAEPFWDAKLRVKGDDGSRSRVTSLRSHGCRIGADYHSYVDAFHIFECIDGTPFGIEVTE